MSKLLKIKVIPRSSTNKIVGEMTDGTLKVKIMAAPTDGEANEALIKFLSKEWNIPKTKIKIKSGHTGRIKLIEILDQD